MKSFFFVSACLLGCTVLAAADDEPLVLPVWEGRPPDFVDGAGAETVDAEGSVGNVTVPQIAVHLPPADKATGLALLVCPGGSYRVNGMFASGMGTVPKFVPQGVAVIVLKYRTNPPVHPVEAAALADAQRAMRLIRLHAAEWHIDPARIGVLGMSAGGHLALNLATHSDAGAASAPDPLLRLSSRPAFLCLLCPWPDRQTIGSFPIDAGSPPAFVASALDDPVAPTAFAASIVDAMAKAGVPAELWTVQKGGHTAFKQSAGEGSHWADHFIAWLTKLGYWKSTARR